MKTKLKVRNWSEYNKALKKRGTIVFTFAQEGIEKFYYQAKQKPGGLRKYTPLMYEYLLIVKVCLRLPWRASVGLVEELLKRSFPGHEIEVPHDAHASRVVNRMKLKIKSYVKSEKEGMEIVLDSTGVNVYSTSGWHQRKHGKNGLYRKRDQWKKIHVALDLNTMEIAGVSYTSSHTNDCEEIEALMSQIEGEVRSIRGDGAYDTEQMYEIGEKLEAKVLIPPARTSKSQDELKKRPKELKAYLSQRDVTIKEIRRYEDFDEGLKKWKESSGYYQRSRVEAWMFRFKRIFGFNLQQKLDKGRLNEIICKINVLNFMTSLGKAQY